MITTLKPDQKRTIRYLEQYGDPLVCVRYRKDPIRRKQFTTVEVIVAEKDWTPNVTTPPDRQVSIRISFSENERRAKVKAAQGRWDKDKKV